MSEKTLDRRRLVHLGLGALGAVLVPAAPLLGSRGRPCDSAGPEARLAPEGEPGEPLRVEGLLFAPDGVTPASGVVVYAYQTDATGLYSHRRGEPPRLRGWMRTDGNGRFSYRTIRPAPYPGGRIPAHVHHQLWGGGYPPQGSEALLFDDDPLVDASERKRSNALGPFAFVRKVETGPEGERLVKIRVRLKSKGDTFEESVRHGLDACGVEVPR